MITLFVVVQAATVDWPLLSPSSPAGAGQTKPKTSMQKRELQKAPLVGTWEAARTLGIPNIRRPNIDPKINGLF